MKLLQKLYSISEKWGKEDVVDHEEKGKYKGKSKEDLCKMRKELTDKEGELTDKELNKLREIDFAIRAKTGWGEVKC